jgi:hypothetical protein
MRQSAKRREDLRALRKIYEYVLACLSNGQNWAMDELTSESSSGDAKEVSLTKLSASADQSTAVESKDSLVSFIIRNMTVPRDSKLAEVCSLLSGKIV